MALTGFASQAVVVAIKKARARTVVKRRAQQIGKQRTFRYSAVSKANLKGLKNTDARNPQEALPFTSDSENQNPSRIVKIKIPNHISDSENQNPNAPVLRSIKKDQDLKKHTHGRVCGSGADLWITRPWSYEKVASFVDDCIAEGQNISREATIKSILRKKDPVDHRLIADRLEKIAARDIQSHAETPPVETVPPNWHGTPLEAVFEAAAQSIGQAMVNTWFRPLQFEGLSDDSGALLASAPNSTVHDWLERHYSRLLKHPDGRPVRLVQRGQGQAAA
jgi:hypothetical protein